MSVGGVGVVVVASRPSLVVCLRGVLLDWHVVDLGLLGTIAPPCHVCLHADASSSQQRGPTVPSFSFALRILLLMRTAGAMYAVIADCDEGRWLLLVFDAHLPVFNFFEPLHYFVHNAGFQTWELSPEFAVRSWAYLLFHWPLATFGPYILGLGKVRFRDLDGPDLSASAVLRAPLLPRRDQLVRGGQVLPRCC